MTGSASLMATPVLPCTSRADRGPPSKHREGCRFDRQVWRSPVFHVEGEVAEAPFALDLQHYRLAALAAVDAAPQRLDGLDGDAVEGVDGVARQQAAVQAGAVERARHDDDAARLAQVRHLLDPVVHGER